MTLHCQLFVWLGARTLFGSSYERRFFEPNSKLACFLFENQMLAAVIYLAGLLCSLPYSEIPGRGGLRRRMSEKSPCLVFCPRNPANLKTSSFATALRLDHPMEPLVASSSVSLGQLVEVGFAKNYCRKLPYSLT